MILRSFPKTMRVDQSAQLKQRINRDSWFHFVSEPITDLRIQHPIGYCYLHATWKPNNQNYSVSSP
jgi:hypothetical protein